ncbi:MAG: decaprenyl-phosphate phosphoribosyltransferase [Candidatus Rokubacteria bacterium]|nr:decaprenyl-phosphate phosphoribosyltransferase [Candidatus Rokubacteria bacterium]
MGAARTGWAVRHDRTRERASQAGAEFPIGANTIAGLAYGVIRDLVASLRSRQWTKNLLVFAGLIFSQNLHRPALVGRVALTFVIFCALSSSMYLVNDVLDVERDRAHPQKRDRPIASGRLRPGLALGTAGGLLALGVVGAFALSGRLGVVALAYAGLLTAYSAGLKHVVILDALIIAAGFVLRALAGVVVIDAEFSHWLLLCTILLALFLTFGKRRHELLVLEAGAADHRPILSEYSPQLLDQMIAVVTATTLMAYALYTVSPETAARLGTPWLPLTFPFVLYGTFRYLYLMYRRDLGGNPSEHLLTDRALLIDVALWAATVVALLYTAR